MAFDYSRTFDHAVIERAPARNIYRGFLKRSFDIALVAIAAVPVLIVVGFLAWLISKDGHSPFYSQQRIGRNGRLFRMWKLRSMIPNADAALEAYLAENPAARLEWDVTQKLKNDPRITRIGRFIRKTSLDELPQLWNVLTGDMAIIGPRPIMRDQKSIYPGQAYYEMRPGLSGYWQTSDRNETSFADRALYDTRYYHDLSFTTDVTLIFRTLRVVLKCTGY